MMSRLKEEERNEKTIRSLLKLPENRRCINCNSLGPQYVCTNFWTFVCTSCSGIHREFTHRVKSVSMAKFTSQEVSALQGGGNASAKEIYFKEWDPQRQSFPDSSNVERLRDFIKHVYVDRRYSGEKSFDKSPRVKGEADDTNQGGSRSPPFRDGKNSEDGKLSNGGFKVEGKSLDHQRDSDISSPPIIRPVREILAEKASPIRAIEPPKPNASGPSDGTLRTQRAVSSSSLGSSSGNPTELKRGGSLIDFDAVPEPPSTAQVSQIQQTVPLATQPTTSSDNNWANFDSFQEVKTVHTPSTTSLLDVLSELSVTASNATPPAGPSGNTQLSVSPPISHLTVAPGPNSFSQWQNVHPQQNQAFARSFNQAVGGSQNNQQLNLSLGGNVNTQVPSSFQVAHGVDVKPTAKKELPADLFSSNFPPFAAPGPGWFPAPQYGMGFNMQYNIPMAMPPVYLQPSKPLNPFDVNESSQVQTATFPSMVPLQGALPNMVPQSSIHRTSSLGTLSPSWMPTQPSNPLPSTSTIQRTSSLGTPSSPWMPTHSSHPLAYGPAMPSGPFMGQVAPNMAPPYRPQAAGGFGFFDPSQQQSGSSFSSNRGNPFG